MGACSPRLAGMMRRALGAWRTKAYWWLRSRRAAARPLGTPTWLVEAAATEAVARAAQLGEQRGDAGPPAGHAAGAEPIANKRTDVSAQATAQSATAQSATAQATAQATARATAEVSTEVAAQATLAVTAEASVEVSAVEMETLVAEELSQRTDLGLVWSWSPATRARLSEVLDYRQVRGRGWTAAACQPRASRVPPNAVRGRPIADRPPTGVPDRPPTAIGGWRPPSAFRVPSTRAT